MPMSFVVFKGERKLADLVTRGYGELKAADRRRAEAAILRANPHLADLKNVAPGTLVTLPRVPGLREPEREDAAVPHRDAAGELDAALEAYGKRLSDAADAERAELAETRALLKSRPFRARLAEVAEAAPYAERVEAALKDREAEHELRRMFLKQIPQARKDLAELAKRLR
jgi:phage tail protein X